MDESIKSPTETHTSRSSFNPFASRTKFGGLKDRAGAAFRAIMPKRRGRVPDLERPRTAPYGLRPRPSTVQKTTGQRPTTAIGRNPKEVDDTRPGTAVPMDEMVEPSQPPSVLSVDTTIQIPRSLFLDLIELAKYDQATALAENLASTGAGQLDVLKPRIEAVNRNAAEMQRWLRDTRDENAQLSEDPESSYKETDDEIATYDVRMTTMEQHLRNIEDQKRSMRSKVDECKNQQRHVNTEVLRAVREQWPDLVAEKTDFTVDPDNLFQVPIDLTSLADLEEDYQEFSRVIKSGADPREDYPFAETGDYATRVLHMRDCKDEYEAAVEDLDDLKGSDEHLSDEELRLQTEDIDSKARSLAHAIEECRRAGVHVLDDGTEIENMPGGPFWDLKRHGHETIIGVMKEDGEIILYDQEEMVSQPTLEEVAAYHERAQTTARTWLERENLGVDPNEAGPASPRTPATPGFASLMREVDMGETPNRESNGSEMADSDLQAQLVEWKAAQDKNRVEAAALVAEHNRSNEDLMEDVRS